MSIKSHAFSIFNAAINSVKPSTIIPEKIKLSDTKLFVGSHAFELNDYRNIYMIGAGKASAAMAYELEKILDAWIKDGLIITNYGNGLTCRKVKIEEAAHPVTDESGIIVSKKLAHMAESFTKDMESLPDEEKMVRLAQVVPNLPEIILEEVEQVKDEMKTAAQQTK